MTDTPGSAAGDDPPNDPDGDDAEEPAPVAEVPVEAGATAYAAVDALAPAKDQLAQAKTELEALLRAAGINRVVFVDNEFEHDVSDVIGAIRDIAPDRRSGVSYLGEDIDFKLPPVDEDVWIQQVEQRWDDLNSRERSIAGADAFARAGRSELHEQPNAGALGPLIPEAITELLSPVEWEDRRDAILDEAEAIDTLLLLDRHFGEGDEGGTALLAAVFADERSSKLRAAILTNSVDRSGEVGLWKDLAKAPHHLPPDRFVVISKENLGTGTLSFPQSLKVALLTPQFDYLQQAVAVALDTAHQRASERIHAISPYSFERLVFESSRQEGVWEPETLVRLATIYTRQEVLKELRSSQLVHDCVRSARRIAAVSTTNESETTAKAKTLANELQRGEVYEDGEYINRVHLPVELGDVFRKRTGTATYVLLAQPCDLMVREGGKRSGEPEFLTLAKLQQNKPELGPEHWYEIPFYYEDGSSAYVLLNRGCPVPGEALDLCVYNTDGSVQIRTDGTPPERVTPHWDQRFEVHRAWAEKAAKAIETAPAGDTRTLVTQAVLRCSALSLASGQLAENNKVVRYNFVRVGRVRQPTSIELLGAFLADQGRMAFEGNLLRET